MDANLKALRLCANAISEIVENRANLDMHKHDKAMLSDALKAARAIIFAEHDKAAPAPHIPDGQRMFKVVQLRDAYHRYEANIIAADADDALAMAEDDDCVWKDVQTSDYDDRTLRVYDADDDQEEYILAGEEDY